MTKLAPITHEELLAILDYNPDTGDFTWKLHISASATRGRVAGTRGPDGTNITIRGKTYRARRLALFYASGIWPRGRVINLNGDHHDNRSANLSEQAYSVSKRHQTLIKSKVRSPNQQSNYAGVTWCSLFFKWQAVLDHEGTRYSLGRFASEEAACLAIRAKKSELAYCDLNKI